MIRCSRAGRVPTASVLVLAAMVLAACGGGDDSDEAAEEEPGDGSRTRESVLSAFPSSFDPIEPTTPVEVRLDDGSSAWVSDTGPDDGTPVLFVGGSSTSATVVDLVSFLSSAREALGLRLISIERNGFGDTPLDPGAGYPEYAATAVAVLDELGVDQLSIVAISGGGPYAAQVASSVPDRIRSLHLAAAYTGTPDAGSLAGLCGLSPEQRSAVAAGYANDPSSWWAFPEDSIVHRIPGFVEAAVADGVRTFRTVDGRGDPRAMEHEFDLFCTPTQVDLSAVEAPAFLYYSQQDSSTPVAFAEAFAHRLPNVVADRRDLGGDHDEQYRHWDQILVDLYDPADPRDLVCVDGALQLVDLGASPPDATLGTCAWSSPA